MAGQNQAVSQKQAPAAQKPQPKIFGKEATPEQIAKMKERADKRAAAKARVLQFLTTLKDTQIVADIKLFVSEGKKRSEGTAHYISSPLRDALVAAGEKGLTGLEIYKVFQLGAPEMRIKMRTLIQKAKPEDRVYVSYNKDTDAYKVVGKGKTPPKGWAGFIPAETEEV